ncbi:alpha/beta hydrolase [Kineosporia babensis]|uniref:Alpha/beta hydrolase n=1 Tax=Kineosporia babensis TaxID=499548 RepID=A0A9X1NCN8_9ACTN|nr:alpha/beta hydrolase [Kineosporia babensis]MCD5311678.1 alpha/beta hydrolase [Kineosporia babensis]
MSFPAASARLIPVPRFTRRAGLGALVAAGLTACTGKSQDSAAETPQTAETTESPADVYTRHIDLSYAENVGRGHLLDLYVPSVGEGPFPVVLFQAGSAFGSDDTKSTSSELSGATTAEGLADRWAPHGYAVVGVNVRSSDQAKFPAQVHDIKAAIRWLRAHAGEYNLDKSRFAAMGTSSGGWGAVMAGVSAGSDFLEGDLGNASESSAVQAVIDLFGPTDFLSMDEHRIRGGQKHNPASSPESQLMGFAIQSDPKATRRANPTTYVTSSAPPIWIAHGSTDALVPYNQSQLLFAAYNNAGAPATFTLVQDVGHTDAYLSGADPAPSVVVHTSRNGQVSRSDSPAPTFDALLAFLDQHLQ